MDGHSVVVGSIGITWDDKALPGGLKSNHGLLDPKLKGRVGIADDPSGVWWGGCVAVGVKDPSRVRPDELRKVSDFLSAVVKQAKTVSASVGDMATLLGSREIDVVFAGWAAINVFAANAGNPNVKSAIPDEGGYSFADLYAIPAKSDNPEAVYAWCNEVLKPAVNARAAEALVGGVTAAKAVGMLNKQTRSLYLYDDLEEQFERAPLYNLPPQKSDEFVTYSQMLATWQEIKAKA